MRRIAHITIRSWPLRTRLARFVLLTSILLGGSLPAVAQRRSANRQQPNILPACSVRPHDQIWLISTRHLPWEGSGCNSTSGTPHLEYRRFDPQVGWVHSSSEVFFRGQNPNIVTTVYVHGNRVTADWAKDHGFTSYCRLLACRHDSQPIRHVIWSWPSDPIPCGARIVKDARVKSQRTTTQSYYLGWWLCQFSPDQRVSLMGFSYGGRTILGALHLVAGGRADGCCFGGNGSRRVHPRMAIFACASEGNWLCAGGRNERALLQINRGLVIFNPNDPALSRYQRFIPGSTGPALGLTGVPRCAIGAGKLRQINAGHTIGNVHRFKSYMNVGSLVNEIGNVVLWPNAGLSSASPASDRSLISESEVSQVPVNGLPTFRLSSPLYEDSTPIATTTPLPMDYSISESPVAELPTFDLAETLEQPAVEQASESGTQLR